MNLEKKVKSQYIPKHIAVIMDGNGRWAKRRGLPRTMGHRAGIKNLKTITLECAKLGVKALSVYAFSTENWNRPKDEIDYLMKLPSEFEKNFKDEFEEYDIKIMFSGRKSVISPENLKFMKRIERSTKNRLGITLNICFDYGSQYEIVEAVKQISKDVLDKKLEVKDINESVISSNLYTKDLPELDLLVRTSGELRISNFLLWQLAYAELYFEKVGWPAFNKKRLLKAIRSFQKRNRRFGGLKEKK